jgi:hypothetical protein
VTDQQSNATMRRVSGQVGGDWVMDVLQPISYLYHAIINHAIFEQKKLKKVQNICKSWMQS